MRVGFYTLLVGTAILLSTTGASASTGDLQAEAGLPFEIDGSSTTTGHGSFLTTGNDGAAYMTITGATGTLHNVVVRSFGYVIPGDPSAKVTVYERLDKTATPITDAAFSWTERSGEHQSLIYNADLATSAPRDALVGALGHDQTIVSDMAYTLEVYAMLDNRPIPFAYDIEAGQYMGQARHGSAVATGAFDAFVQGSTIVFEHDGERRLIAATNREETRPGTIYNPLTDSWSGAGSHTEYIQEYLQLDLDAGRFHAVYDGARATSHIDQPRIDVRGSTLLPTATGSLHLADEGVTHDFERQDVSLSGAYTLAPRQLHDQHTRTLVTGEGDWTYVEYGAVQAEYDWAQVAAVVGFGAALIAAAIWLVAQGKSLLAGLGGAGLVAGYARVHGEAVLEHEGRRAVYEAIQENPGLSITRLGEVAGCNGSTLNYHLRVLERNDLVISQRDGRYLRFFDRKSGLYANGRKTVVAALRNDTTAAIGGAILHNPGVPQCDLAEAFGIAASTVNWHIRRLMDAGLVDKTRDGHFTRYFAGDNWSKLPAEEAARFGLAS